MSRQFFCPICGNPLDMYTQHVHSKQHGDISAEFGTCRQDGCQMENMTLSTNTWERMIEEPGLRATYGLDHLNYDPVTGKKREA